MSDQWMSYTDAATALGMTPESVRQRARREHWRKQLANDGRAMILVPSDTSRSPPGDAADDAPAPRPVKRPESDTALATLQARFAEMEARVRDLAAEVDRERGERLQERDRSERLVGEVATLARQLAATVQEAATQERLRAETLAAELDTLRSRPWWRRLVG